MKVLYMLVFLFLLTSCVTTLKPVSRIDYLGSSLPATENIDVFVDLSAIEKPFKIIGKGYVRILFFTTSLLGKIQAESVAKAKANGADAVLIQDYYLPAATGLSTVLHTDSVGKGTVTTGNTTVQQTGAQQFTILFLKYK